MADPFVAEIRIFGFNFPPKGWAFCDGQLMAISQNTALFSLLGTNYGGDGKSTFGLPDLQGASPIAWGQGPGLSDRFIGEQSGSESVSLIPAEIPQHTHTVQTAPGAGTLVAPDAGSSWATPSGGRGQKAYAPPPASATMGYSTEAAGQGLPHENRPPYLTMNFCIALQGVFPPRD
jgi:microcystin-dependent protein